MADLKTLLKDLISAPGLSGYETPVRRRIEQAWQPLVDELSVSRLGSLHGLKRGHGKEPRNGIVLAAHMDTIGLMVTRVEGEFLYITEVGGIDDRVLPGQPVIVHGQEELPGIVVQPPAWLLPPEDQRGPVSLESLLVDTGLPARQLARKVRVGNLVTFAQPALEMGKDHLAGHSLDNRASIAALTHCLEELQNRKHAWDVWAVATAQEEETLGGAATSAHALHPSLAVVIDVTHGKGPGSPDHLTFPLGKGPALGWGPNIHPALFKAFKDTAKEIELPIQTEVMPRHSGTDAITLQVASEGISTMVVSIPLRYMHTPVELVSLQDITRTGRLLAAFIAGLKPDFMATLTWDD